MDSNRQDLDVDQKTADTSVPPKAYVGEGPQFSGSYALRHLHYDVDAKLARQYNENYKEHLKMVFYFFIAAFISGGLGAWLLSLDGFWLTLLGIVTSLISLILIVVALLVIKRMARPTALLKRGLLNAGIVTQIDADGVGILVLAETTAGPKMHWGLCSVRFKCLPPVHNKQVGERIPVTCVFSGFEKGYYEAVTPSLIGWGTNDQEVIQLAIDAISEIEWNVLAQCADRYDFKKEYSEEQRLKQLTSEEIISLNLDKA